MEGLLAVVMAGGRGARLRPLTSVRAKPAVPFGGIYRIIDFTLSNCVNSRIKQIYVLSQYKSHSLSNHLRNGWDIYSSRLEEFITEIPAQMQQGDQWYSGTADAIRQNLHFFERSHPSLLLVLAGDHVYKMDYRLMRAFHEAKHADLTIGTVRLPARVAAGSYGVLEVDANMRVLGFDEKPAEPGALAGTEDCLASMGIYLFNWERLVEGIGDYADFGKDVLPAILEAGYAVYAYDFTELNVIEEYEYRPRTGYRERELVPRATDSAYWRDVGTLDAFWQANLDLVSIAPRFNLYGELWPIYSYPMHYPPAKFVHEYPGRTGVAYNSIIADGVIVSGATIRNSLLGPGIYVHSYASIESSYLLGGNILGSRQIETAIGRGCHIRNAIVDKNVRLGEGTRVGFDRAEDEARGFATAAIAGADGYVVCVPKGTIL
jgi:glucose-1-phosphate adenylyltransferase